MNHRIMVAVGIPDGVNGGVILAYEGFDNPDSLLQRRVELCGPFLDDHELTAPEHPGIWIWEGTIIVLEPDFASDGQTYWDGKWRVAEGHDFSYFHLRVGGVLG